MPATRISEVERAYFVRKSGGADPTKPFSQIKRDYIASFIGGISNTVRMVEIEKLWLQKIAATAGYTPGSGDSDLWKQAVMSISQVPSTRVNDNKIIFFVNAP